MSKQYPGGLITKTPVVPTSLSAPGIWSLSDQAKAQATNTWPFPRDPQFNYVTMLLHGDGSAGAVAMGSGAGTSSTVTNFNADASTNNFNLTINGDARSDNFMPYQAGYYSNFFDGTDDFLSYASTTTLNFGTADFTVECWINLGNTTSSKVLIGGTATNAFGFRYGTAYLSNNGLSIYRSGAADLENCSFSFVANTWYHVAVVRQSSVIKYFVDGVQQTTAGSGGASYNFPTETNVRIGTSDIGAEDYIGNISNLRVTKSAVYTSNFTPSTTPLTAVANTALLTCQSNRFIDNSTNNFTITQNGNTAVTPAQPFTLPSSVATYGSGYFDGTGDYLTAPSNSAFAFGTGDFTVECWAYFTSVANFPTLTDSRATTSSTAGFNLGLSTAKVQLYTTSQVLIGSTTLVANTWYHIAVTRSGTTLKIWLNGVQDATVSNSTNWSDTTLLIGSTPTPTNYMTGYITDTRLVKGTAVYSATFTPPTTPLTAITNTSLLTTQYNGGGNNSGFKDSSQFNFPITRNGNTTQGTFTPYGSNWSNFFNGSSGVTVSSTSSQFGFTGDFTWEAWINPSALPSSGNVVSIICSRGSVASNSAFQFLFGNTSGTYRIEATISIGASDSGLSWNIPTAPTVGVWYHVAVVRSGSSVQAYWNGSAIGSAQTASGTTNTPTVNPSIGFRGGSYNDLFFNGYISNFRMVGSAVYTSAFTPSITPLTAISGTRLLTCQSNRFIDNSTNNFTLTAYSSPSVQGFSPFAPLTVYNPATYSGSMYLDGTTDFVKTPSDASLSSTLLASNFTIECWLYVISLPDGPTIWTNSVSNSDGFSGSYLQTNGTIGTGKYGVNEFNTTNSIKLNTWNHFALVRNSGTLYVYLNGVQDPTTGSASTYLNTSATKPMQIGCSNQSPPASLNGYISDFRVVTSALYTASFTPNTTPLTAVTGTNLLLSTTNPAILDNAMMNNLETVGNAAVSTSVKKYGAASMYFDGTGDNLNIPVNENTNFGSGNFTIEGWLYLNTTGVYQVFFSRTLASVSGYGGTWLRVTDTNVLQAAFSSGTTAHDFTITCSTALSASTWYHVAYVRNGSAFNIYLNGTSNGSATSSATMYSAGTTVTVGVQTNSNSAFGYLNGYIDDLRITKGVARYTANFTAPDQAFPNG